MPQLCLNSIWPATDALVFDPLEQGGQGEADK